MDAETILKDTAAINNMPIAFIMAKGRSGTTLLQVMLNAHPNIAAPPESRFIVLLYRRYGSIKNWTEETINNFCRDLFRERKFRWRWQLDQNKLRNSLLSVKDSLTYPIACKMVFLEWASHTKQANILLDKNPIYYFFLPTIEKIFPDAKYIHIVRDYRATIASHQRVFKMKKAADLAYRWLKINKLIEKSKQRNPERYFTLKYEELVANPELCMKEICSFLSVPFSEKMTEDHTASIYPSFKETNKEQFLEIHTHLFQPITQVHVDEWKQKLSVNEVAEAETVAGEYAAAKFGYAKTLDKPAKLNFIKLLFIRIRYTFLKIIYKIAFNNFSLFYFVKRNIWKNF